MCKQVSSSGPLNKHVHLYFLPIANYYHFMLNQYQEVGQKPGNTEKQKKNLFYQRNSLLKLGNECPLQKLISKLMSFTVRMV